MPTKKKRPRNTMPYSLARLRKAGYVAGIVEKWNPHARCRQDFLGFADIVAVHPGHQGCIAVQTCTLATLAVHVRKIMETEKLVLNLHSWLAAGNYLEVWGWSLKGMAGKRKLVLPTDRAIVPGDDAFSFRVVEYSLCFSEQEQKAWEF